MSLGWDFDKFIYPPLPSHSQFPSLASASQTSLLDSFVVCWKKKKITPETEGYREQDWEDWPSTSRHKALLWEKEKSFTLKSSPCFWESPWENFTVFTLTLPLPLAGGFFPPHQTSRNSSESMCFYRFMTLAVTLCVCFSPWFEV